MSSDPRPAIAERLAETRARTLALLAPVADEDYAALHSPFAGPLAWDVGHVPGFEELWLVKRTGPDRARYAGATEGLDPRFDAAVHAKPERAKLALPTRDEATREMARVRAAALAALEKVPLDASDPLLADAFVHHMVLNHEAQHQETMLITLALMPKGRYVPPREGEKPRRAGAKPDGFARVRAGAFRMGSQRSAGTYDNEWPAHEVDVPAFNIGRAPVTNGEYLRFVEAGGYDREEFWSEDGWMMKLVRGWRHPLSWSRREEGWTLREFDRESPLPLDAPVTHVSWYEAEAYARFAGARLPTEAEWEKAARWDPATGATRAFPWGDAPWEPRRANLGARLFGVADAGAYPDGVSAVGAHQMVGDVWEWTASEFEPYDGFEAFPYDGYSVPFMKGGYFVLKGGSWATAPSVARPAFRNWHQPDHQQEFAGFRLAKDVDP
ncbi:MAG TPA: ergothioneine biosynthesis protein EgtB [Candidatus Thermoplasmatota archaeon]|nr:ergothioneine biosynthesis protein EgtB [Candidatus Thermoplasmatota archaeon]